MCNLFLFVKGMTSEGRISSWLLIVLRDITGMSLQMELGDLGKGEGERELHVTLAKHLSS